jgi:hypothetical protein
MSRTARARTPYTVTATDQRNRRSLQVRQTQDGSTITVRGARGALLSTLEVNDEQATMIAQCLAPILASRVAQAQRFAEVLRDLARAIHRYEATDDTDLIGEDTCQEAFALRSAAERIVALVDADLRDAWQDEDLAQWRRDYPRYALGQDSA